MKNQHFHFLLLLAGGLLLASCKPAYQVATIDRSRILVDQRYDAQPDAAAAQFIAPYKHVVDSIMSPVVGRTAQFLDKDRPESLLSNVLTDILVWGSARFGEHPDFAVYNMGGMRAAFAKGETTYGDVVEVAPFENKICFLTLSGEQTLELFRQIAHRGGEGLSHSVRMVITRDGQLLSVSVGGEPVTPDRTYRVVTLDYLAQGNDGLTAFKTGTNVVSPQAEENNVRYIIMDYFRAEAAAGRAVDAQLEGRCVVK